MSVRENIRENVQVQDSKAFGIAALVGSIPLPLTIFVIALVCLFIAGAAGFHAQSVPVFIDTALNWLKWGFIVVVCLVVTKTGLKLGMAIYDHYHKIRITSMERQASTLKLENLRLKNRQLAAKVSLEEQLPAVMKYAIDAGHNIKYAGMEVTGVFSNVHTLGAGPALPGGHPQQLLTGPAISKPTIEDIVRVVKPNSFELCLGKSLTTGQPIMVSLPGCHIKVIGASQMGKSCMIASLLEQARQTHDKQHLLLAILDLEDMTGKLFENDAHILTVRDQGQLHKVHAHSPEEVASQVILLHRVMLHRYELAKLHGFEYVEAMPRILIYMEEFIYWKRMLANFVDEDTEEQAIGAVTGIATRGLKVGMHLAIAAQVNYEDKDLKDAFAQFIGVSVSFAVKPSAARAAGFVSTELLNENYAAKQRGQYVVEMIGGAEIGVAPDYDVRALVKQIPRNADSRPAAPVVDTIPDLSELTRAISQAEEPEAEEAEEPAESSTDNIRRFPIIAPERKPAPSIDDAVQVWNEAIGEGVILSRYTLRDRLVARGFECGENRAREFLTTIKTQIEQSQQRA